MAKFYSDLDLRMIQHPIKKDITLLEDDEAVKMSIKNIVLTNKKEKRFQSNFGGNMRNYLFEDIDFILQESIKDDLIDLITRYESRITELKIKNMTSPDDNTLSFTIQYKILNYPQPFTLDMVINKVR